ncbi:Biopolymer transport protein ExbD/TolR [Denitrovibrio acetiphilus DSM 12809]|uniref:Biopolymer transport protein ExbD/TolR n=1 Tax=Denitrovibrio acetiphilus (strain DSM 12809 / NBRC 114555 / N2460) TaxID=522772 RepID=D4H6A0_DENA2|nr:biopolymer transporter ExbD [Denitrovibrio acetiphilus]ADD67746.1 Biopolymer transport protein ExbD/TolR [Denitrovibrio acetiphilus DSM 12809]
MRRISSKKSTGADELNMTPMIDLIFLLLVFFIVTTSFTKETGVDVARPAAKTAEKSEALTVMMAIDDTGAVFLEKKQIDVRSIRGRMSALSSDNPDISVMLVADRKANVEDVVAVMDQCRLAGVEKISLSAEKKF